jgi:tRNA threonylcarbamoyladenosine biosynthesis protein TsaE
MRVEQRDGQLVVEVASEAETERLGRAVAGLVVPGTVIGLVGELGAGKTRLVRAVAAALGVDPEEVVSPTFVLIHEYEGDLPVYHFDAYRLGGPASFEALGVSDYWEAGGVCLVEWADLVAGVMPEGAWRIAIESTGPSSRRFVVDMPAPLALADALREEGPAV